MRDRGRVRPPLIAALAGGRGVHAPMTGLGDPIPVRALAGAARARHAGRFPLGRGATLFCFSLRPSPPIFSLSTRRAVKRRKRTVTLQARLSVRAILTSLFVSGSRRSVSFECCCLKVDEGARWGTRAPALVFRRREPRHPATLAPAALSLARRHFRELKKKRRKHDTIPYKPSSSLGAAAPRHHADRRALRPALGRVHPLLVAPFLQPQRRADRRL